MRKLAPVFSSTALLVEVARLMREDFRKRAQHLRLTQPQWRVLLQLSQVPGLNQAALAERLEVHPVTITQIVERLVAAGWVRRERPETDRRAVNLYLTEGAAPLLVELNRIASDTRDTALAGFANEERRQFEAMLLRIKRNFCGASASLPEKKSS